MKRTALLLVLVLVAFASTARADSISIALANGQGVTVATTPTGITNTPWAGSLALHVNTGAYSGLDVLAYCVDIYHWAAWSEDVTITTTDVLGTGVPVNVDANAGQKAAYLYKTNQLGQTLDAAHSAALQVAIWEVLYDTASPNLNRGDFVLKYGVNDAVASYAKGYLSDLSANYAPTTGILFLAAQTGTIQQSFIAMTAVPEPTSLLLFGSGLLSLGVMAKRRRAKR
jgi:hypothetical protein